MPRFCKKCNAVIPNRVIVDDKEYTLHRRSNCLVCSPLFSKNGHAIRKEIKNLPNSKKCPICDRVFNYTKNDICSTCRTFYQRHKTKVKCVQELGGQCKICGISDVDILSFHHRNPTEKSFTLAGNLNSVAWDSLKTELTKCDLLCMNCHVKTHKMQDFERKEKIRNYYLEKEKKDIEKE